MTQDPGSGAPMSERMQSLLSRAVEDQLTEQRQLAGALSELRTQLGQLGTQLDALHGGGGGAQPNLDEALGSIAGQVREGVRLLGERLDTVGRLVQERGHDLAEQRAMIGELKTALDRHTSALDGMTGGLAALPAFGERIDSLQGGLGGLADRLQGLEELTSAVSALQQRTEAVDSGLRELRQAFTGVAARAAQLPGREELDAATGRVSESVDGLGGRLSRLETSVPSLLERLDSLAEAHADTASTLQDISGRLAAESASAPTGDVAGAEIAALREEIAALREQLPTDAGDEDIGALTDRLDALHEGLFGSGGVADRLRGLEATGDEPAGTGVDADTVAAAVAQAVAASEQRITEHVDEAILTLAEALLRRRARQRPTGLGAVLGAGEIESAAMGADDDISAPAGLVDGDEDEPDDDDEDDEQDDIEDELDEDSGQQDDSDDEDESPRFGRPVGTPWQTPTPAGAEAEVDADETEGAEAAPSDKRRRPWWRPGG